MDADGVIAALHLEPHPEGGRYRQTWSDAGCSAVYYLLQAGERSEWHRVFERSEIWHYYAGAPLELSIIDAAGARDAVGGHAVAADAAVRGERGVGSLRTTKLGTDLAGGERPQAVVPAGAWQSARSLGPWSLVGCTVAPPFTFDAFELAPEGFSRVVQAAEPSAPGERPPPGAVGPGEETQTPN